MTDTPSLQQRVAEALMRWAERNNSPQYASMRRPETVRQNAHERAAAVLAELKPELDALAALRAVARGYCPACGRGDAAPSVADWEQQRKRAAQAEKDRTILGQAAVGYQQRAWDAEAAIARIRAVAEQWQASVRPGEPHPAAAAILAALDQPTPAAATRATDDRSPQ
jgi:hypothetical protein